MASWRELQDEIKEGLEERKSRNRGLNLKRKSLMTAIRQQQLETVDRLLNQGIDLNFRDASGDSPLHVACLNACSDETSTVSKQIIEYLVYMGADLEVQDRFSRLPLHVAASQSHHTVQILLDKGCCINAQDNSGCTALMAACQTDSRDPVDTVTLLLENNANVHLADEQGFTALHYICHNTSLDTSLRNSIALLLLNAGLSATVCDGQGRMALCLELDKLMHISYRVLPYVKLDLVETLICAGSNLRHRSTAHQYWVRYAINTANPKVLLTLLQLFSPVITRPSLRMISKAIADLKSDDKVDGTATLQTEVHRLVHSVDTLQCICRLSVRAYLRGKMLIGAPQLPLPNKLKSFLMSLDRKPL